MPRHDDPATTDGTADVDATSASSATDPGDQTTEVGADDGAHTETDAVADPGGPIKRRRRPGRRTMATCAALLAVGASVASIGYMRSYNTAAAAGRQLAAEYAAAARQSTINLMSLNSKTAREDLQRAIDDATGSFMAGMLLNSEDLAKTMEQTTVSTKVTVESTAVDSMTNDSAVVLVAARTEVTNAEGAPPPRLLRIVMDLQRIDGQPKVAKVALVP